MLKGVQLSSGGGGVSWLGGPTAGRPASPVLYEMYFDTDLGQPIWVSSIGGLGAQWVNAAGSPV